MTSEEARIKTLQDFACQCSVLVWGGELGWDREGGLEALFSAIEDRFKNPEKNCLD